MKYLILLVGLMGAMVVAWAVGPLRNEDAAEPLNPRELLSQRCEYLSADSLNTIFDKRPAGSEFFEAVEKVDWEFNNAGVWQQNSRSCNWQSSNISGLEIVIVAREFLPSEKLDAPNEFPPFVKRADDFGSIDRRFKCFRPADKAAILHTSNYGEGGIAMTWGLFTIHVHVIAENETDLANIKRRIDTELEAEWVLARHILERFESYRELNPTQVLDSGERDECI